MADIKSPTERYKAIADAIREKSGTTELMQPADMPQAILDIVSGGGSQYTSIVYNEDNTITLTDKDGVIHTMECEYTEGKLTSVKYDGKVVELVYDGDLLVKVGKTAVDVANAQTYGIEPLDHTVTFTVDGEPYEVVSVKSGNTVNEPTRPKKDSCAFIGWNDSEGNTVSFPITPTTDIVFLADLQPSLAYYFVTALGIDYNIHPHVIIFTREIGEDLRAFIYICSNMPIGDGREHYVKTPGEHYYQEHIVISWETDVTDVRSVIDSILDVKPTLTTRTGGGVTLSNSSFLTFDFDGRADDITLFV